MTSRDTDIGRDREDYRTYQRGRTRTLTAAQRARALERLSRTALANLASPDLLRELLDGVREVMAADNAAILLPSQETQAGEQSAGRELRLYAVRGPEEAVSGDVRIPIGSGVAGTIVATGAPLLIDDLATVTVANPFLGAHLRSLVGVPLRVHGRVIGAMHVDSVRKGHFTPDDMTLLEQLAEPVALAIDHARLFAAEQQARREAESARREAEAQARRLETVFSAITDQVYVYDTEMRLVHVNPTARAALPPDDREYDSRPAAERWVQYAIRDREGHPISAEKLPIRRILRGEVLLGDSAVDTAVRTRDGQDVLYSTTGAPLRDADGRIVGGVIVVRDVTERRALEHRTQEALEALLAMAEALVQVPEGLTAQPHARPGRPEREPSHHAPAPSLAPGLGRGGTELRPPDVASTAAHSLADLAVRVLGCRHVSIVSLATPTAAARESDRLYPVAIAGLTPEQEREWWARYAHGVPVSVLIDDEQLARLRAGDVFETEPRAPAYRGTAYGIGRTIAVPLRIGEALVGVMALDFGSARQISTEERMLAGAVGKLMALIVQREHLVREREEARANALALAEANRRMSEFLSIASHELRTPLTSIRVSIELLVRRAERMREQAEREARAGAAGHGGADGMATGERQGRIEESEMLMRAQTQLRRLTRLLDDLVDVSRIEAGQLRLRPARIDLVEVVRDAVAGEQLAHPERTIALEAAKDASIMVIADADRVAQVVTNFLTNALKYSAADLPVAVSVRVVGASALVAVRDQGPGIPPEEQPHVWELFHRVPGVAVVNGSGIGLGLGLHISKTIIERHGGAVGVESVPGQGATFWFTLPLGGEEASGS